MAAKGLWLRSAGYASTPDIAAFDITGNISLRADLTHKHWRPDGQKYLVNKYDHVGNNRSYALTLEADGKIKIVFSTDGTTPTSVESTVAVPQTHKPTRLAVRVDRNATTGDCTFFTAPTRTDTWVQLGAVATGITGNLFSGNAPVVTGQSSSLNGTGTLTDACIHGLEIFDDVTLVADPDFDATSVARNATSITDTFGRVWTPTSAAYLAKETFNRALIVPEVAELAKLFAEGVSDPNLTILDTFAKDLALKTFTPVVTATSTNPNFGSDAIAFGAYRELPGGYVMGWAGIEAAGTGISNGNGFYRFSLPEFRNTTHTWADSTADTNSGDGEIIGTGFYHDDSSTTNSGVGAMQLMPNLGTGRAMLMINKGPTTWAFDAFNPYVLAAGDAFVYDFFYRRS